MNVSNTVSNAACQPGAQCRETPEERIALRQARSKLIFNELEDWLHAQLPKISGKSPLAQAIRYALALRMIDEVTLTEPT